MFIRNKNCSINVDIFLENIKFKLPPAIILTNNKYLIAPCENICFSFRT